MEIKIDGKKEGVVLYITEQAYNKMWQYVKAVSTEIEGLGYAYLNTERDPEATERMIIIEDMFILEQEVSSASATIKEEAIHKYLAEKAKKEDMRPINVWWHSHADMGTFWSGIDTGTAGKFMNADWMVHIVGNLKGKYRAKLNIYKPYPIPIDDCVIERLDSGFQGLEVSDDIKKEVKDKVLTKTYAGYNNGNWNRNKNNRSMNGYGGYYDGYGGYHADPITKGGKDWDNDKNWNKDEERESEDYTFDIDHIFIKDRIWAPTPRAMDNEKLLMKGIVIEILKDTEELVVYFPKEQKGSNVTKCSIEDIEVDPAEVTSGYIGYDVEKDICDELYSRVTKSIKEKDFVGARRKIAGMRIMDKWGADKKYNLTDLSVLMLKEETEIKKDKGNKEPKGKDNAVVPQKRNKNK